MRMSSLLSDRPSAVERAYELARDGSCASVFEIRKQMKIEGYAIRELTAAPSLTRSLGKLCATHAGGTQVTASISGK